MINVYIAFVYSHVSYANISYPIHISYPKILCYGGRVVFRLLILY